MATFTELFFTRNNQLLTLSKLEAILCVTRNNEFIFHTLENIVKKGENTGYWLPAFSPFQTMFSKVFFFS